MAAACDAYTPYPDDFSDPWPWRAAMYNSAGIGAGTAEPVQTRCVCYDSLLAPIMGQNV